MMAGWVHSTPVSIVPTTIPSPRSPVCAQTPLALTAVMPHSIASEDTGSGAADRPGPPSVRIAMSAAAVTAGRDPFASPPIIFFFFVTLASVARRRARRIAAVRVAFTVAALAEVVSADVDMGGEVSKLAGTTDPARARTPGV